MTRYLPDMELTNHHAAILQVLLASIAKRKQVSGRSRSAWRDIFAHRTRVLGGNIHVLRALFLHKRVYTTLNNVNRVQWDPTVPREVRRLQPAPLGPTMRSLTRGLRLRVCHAKQGGVARHLECGP